MYTAIYILLAIVSLCISTLIFAQPSNQESLTSAFTGGSNLFETKKIRGFQKVLRKWTIILASLLVLITLVAQIIF